VVVCGFRSGLEKYYAHFLAYVISLNRYLKTNISYTILKSNILRRNAGNPKNGISDFHPSPFLIRISDSQNRFGFPGGTADEMRLKL